MKKEIRDQNWSAIMEVMFENDVKMYDTQTLKSSEKFERLYGIKTNYEDNQDRYELASKSWIQKSEVFVGKICVIYYMKKWQKFIDSR